MLQVPSKRMPAVHIIYTSENKQANMDDKAHWNLRGGVKFLESPASTQTLNYYMVVGPNLRKPGDTSEMYQASINRQIKDNGIGSGASCLAMASLPPYDKDDLTEPTGKQKYQQRTQIPKTHEELKQDIEHAINSCKQQHSGGQLVVLLLRARSIAPYSAFKDVADRNAGLHSFCVTEEKNFGKTADDSGLSLYTANVMMKVNLKLRGRNHTSADGAKGEGRISATLSVPTPSRSTMILGADVSLSLVPKVEQVTDGIVFLGHASRRWLTHWMPFHCYSGRLDRLRWWPFPWLHAHSKREQERGQSCSSQAEIKLIGTRSSTHPQCMQWLRSDSKRGVRLRALSAQTSSTTGTACQPASTPTSSQTKSQLSREPGQTSSARKATAAKQTRSK
jgi:hypothetical protein